MTNRQPQTTTAAADPTILARYEDLRRQALQMADPASRGSGLVMFVRQGMKNWMEAWSQCMPSVPTRPMIKARLDQVPPVQWSREVVSILASMALGSFWEARR
jgi:hypothetical protein